MILKKYTYHCVHLLRVFLFFFMKKSGIDPIRVAVINLRFKTYLSFCFKRIVKGGGGNLIRQLAQKLLKTNTKIKIKNCGLIGQDV